MGCTSSDFERCLKQKFKIEIITEETNENELQCAACGFIGKEKEFFNSLVHNKFKICPNCGTVRFAFNENKEYRQ